jgi:hypothetical protein
MLYPVRGDNPGYILREPCETDISLKYCNCMILLDGPISFMDIGKIFGYENPMQLVRTAIRAMKKIRRNYHE